MSKTIATLQFYIILTERTTCFKNSPARCADYTSLTGSSVFPKKFCQVRWLANVDVATRALEVLPHIKKYITDKSTVLPSNSTCRNIKEACSDRLITARTHFFISVASIVEPFLRKYQTSKPMVPFLYQDLGTCLRTLMMRFVKKDALKAADTVAKLCKIDVKDKQMQCTYKEVDIGVAAKAELRHCKVSERDIMQFKMECISFLAAMAAKIVERSPAKHNLVRFASSLLPASVLNSSTIAQRNFSGLLEILFETCNISSGIADSAKNQYIKLCECSQEDLKLSFESYSPNNRLDTFYYELLGRHKDFQELWHVMKLILVLSHGNAAVESGFSINEEMLVENLHEDSLVGQRIVFDAIQNAGDDVMSVNIDKRLLQFVRSARARWEEALKAKKDGCNNEKNEAAAKKRVASAIKDLEAKKAKLVADAATAVSNVEQELNELKAVCSMK